MVHHVYSTESVCKVVVQKSIPTQICQLISSDAAISHIMHL
jgi:hypothetical protein